MAKPSQWFLILRLAQQGSIERPVFTSTTALGREFNCSQQTVSRWLKSLSEGGYVERRINLRGEYIKLTTKGLEELTSVYWALNRVLKAEEPQPILIEGRVFTGLGEGAYYISRVGYKKQLITKLGFEPYPGTLNLKLLKPASIAWRRELETKPGIVIDGFSNGSRTYGSLKSFRAVVNNRVGGAVLLIQRTHYDFSVIEVIAPVYLRGALKISDNDTVRLEIFP